MSMNTGQSMGERPANQAEKTGARMREQTYATGQRVRQGAEDVRQSVAVGMHNAAMAMRQNSTQMGKTGLVSRMAEPLDRSAEYLGGHNWAQIGSDVRQQAQDHPGWAAAGVFATAFLLGRLLRRW
jgi:hypothetical protein